MKGWCLIDVDERLIFDWQLNFCSAGHPNFKLRIEEKLMFDWCWWTIDFWLIFDCQLCLTSQFQTESWWQIYVWLMLMKDWFWLTTQLLLSWPSQFQTDIWWKNDVWLMLRKNWFLPAAKPCRSISCFSPSPCPANSQFFRKWPFITL